MKSFAGKWLETLKHYLEGGKRHQCPSIRTEIKVVSHGKRHPTVILTSGDTMTIHLTGKKSFKPGDKIRIRVLEKKEDGGEST
jgi:hypothetical protein